jgi:predicted O-linked N-acetylglucosamine transferase (SPINDLY family)
VLWLLCDHPQTQHHLTQEAAVRGVGPERLVFAKRQDRAAHLARHALADLFLDTAPYNAHTTASDALWMGLPVLTLKGRSFASRVAASLLQCSGLGDLVTHHLTDYEDQAVALGQNPAALATLKRQLESGRMANPLFDTAAFTRHLEAAFAHMVDRWRSGLAAAPFAVQNDGSAVSPPGAQPATPTRALQQA